MSKLSRLSVLGGAMALILVGAGCASTTTTPSADKAVTTPSASSAITLTSPKANDVVSDPFVISGKAPVGQTVYATASIDGNLVSMTMTDPDESGNFEMDALPLGSVFGNFTLDVFNMNDNGDHLDAVIIPLTLK